MTQPARSTASLIDRRLHERRSLRVDMDEKTTTNEHPASVAPPTLGVGAIVVRDGNLLMVRRGGSPHAVSGPSLAEKSSAPSTSHKR